jgi:hypothetical protein
MRGVAWQMTDQSGRVMMPPACGMRVGPAAALTRAVTAARIA